MTTPTPGRPASTLDLLIARAHTALQNLADYEPTNLAETAQILNHTAGTNTPSATLTDHLATIADRTGRSHHLTALPDQGDLVQACTAYYAGIVQGPDGEGPDVITEAINGILRPWDARTAAEFHAARHVHTDEPPTDTDTILDRALARITTEDTQ